MKILSRSTEQKSAPENNNAPAIQNSGAVDAVSQGKGKPKKKKKVSNPWLNARDQYRDHFQMLSQSKLWWQMGAIACFMLMFGAMATALSTANRSNYIPYIVAVDDHGVAIATGLAHQTTKADEKIIVATLADFITNARTVTVDVSLIRKAIYSCYAHILREDPARAKIDEWFSGNSGVKTPFERAGDSLVSVKINSVVAQTATTYQVDWVETERDRSGKRLKADTHMRALITWGYGPQKETVDEITYNPMSVYIKDFNWSEVN